jgi:hypothetical protein
MIVTLPVTRSPPLGRRGHQVFFHNNWGFIEWPAFIHSELHYSTSTSTSTSTMPNYTPNSDADPKEMLMNFLGTARNTIDMTMSAVGGTKFELSTTAAAPERAPEPAQEPAHEPTTQIVLDTKNIEGCAYLFGAIGAILGIFVVCWLGGHLIFLGFRGLIGVLGIDGYTGFSLALGAAWAFMAVLLVLADVLYDHHAQRHAKLQ